MEENKCAEKKHSKWLIMVYLAGDNNLSAFSIAFLQQLEAADPNRYVRVVAGFDSTTPWPKGARYLELKRHKDPASPYKKMKWPLHNDLVQPGHIVFSPDFCEKYKQPKPPDEPIAKEALARFLDWVRENYSADKYMLILFGHGTLVAGNTFLADTNPPSYLRLKEFSEILDHHFKSKLDIVAFDNCVMNAIETAAQLWKRVHYTIGSQGLVLANGWPITEIIQLVGLYHDRGTDFIAEQILRACARNLLDFALMERSSEQAIIDVSKFGPNDQLLRAVRGLSGKLQTGLKFKPGTCDKELMYPQVRDVVRLARLEAQSYWSETFVDLYDFASLLLDRCNDFLGYLRGMMNSVFPKLPSELESRNTTVKDYVTPWPVIPILKGIVESCSEITEIFRTQKIVPHRYYVGPQLQYSNGVSIYFPWSLPEGPITFDPVNKWQPYPTNYYLKTPFQEYETYPFATRDFGDWSRFLKAFFRATLRNVRVSEYKYTEDKNTFRAKDYIEDKLETVLIDLQKSSSSTGEPAESDEMIIKNYPRRFYISPADCKRRMKVYGADDQAQPAADEVTDAPGKVSYLGWNIRGLLAEEVGLEPWMNLVETQKPGTNDCD
jgi:hypothetical protein